MLIVGKARDNFFAGAPARAAQHRRCFLHSRTQVHAIPIDAPRDQHAKTSAHYAKIWNGDNQ